MSDSFAESVHFEAGRTLSAIFHRVKRLCKNRVGSRATKSLQKLKELPEKLPMLSSLEQGQHLILYVSTMHASISGALIVEKEIASNGKVAKQPFPVYFVSEVLTGSKRFYSEMEKIYYAVVMSARKLRHYFKAHTIKVLTNQAPNDIFSNRDSYGRINKCSMELLEHVVEFKKCSAIKPHILADFVAEWTEPGFTVKVAVPESAWLICCDRAWVQQEPEQLKY
jgi:hypothetical protein